MIRIGKLNLIVFCLVGPVSFVGRVTPAEEEFSLNLNSLNINNNNNIITEEALTHQTHSRRSSSQSTGSSRRSSNYSNADSRRSSRLIENVTLSGDEEEENAPVVELGDFATDVLAEDRGAELDWSEFGVSLSLNTNNNRGGVRLSKLNLGSENTDLNV